ncbi:RR2A [Plodia interpunctella granulovirus]|uniref:ribonucleoside-diphosphate reductase n=1 Tax=Plodia interpunctella granulovirus TaxID=262175 RepID=A0A1L5JH42_9BBAC|nr:RR2A [Plodia interpunctella granulovirus]APO13997.1 RR2A [Plodia interpunctella granulovirus]
MKLIMDRITKWFDGEFKSETLPRECEFSSSTANDAKSLQIWPPTYEPSWYYYQQHQANYWSASEHDPMDDFNGFVQLDRGWQNALLHSFAILAIGDDKIMTMIDASVLQWEESTKWLFADQAARETIHKIVYNKMLQLARGAQDLTVDDLTSDRYGDYIMSSHTLDYSHFDDKVYFLTTMIFCERYLFAAPFLIINLMGESGLLNTCVKINMQVMKDEHVHYMHAVQLLKDLPIATEKTHVVDFLARHFQYLVEKMVAKMCHHLDDQYLRGILDHTRFTLRTIFVDVGVPVPQRLENYTSTPFSVFDKNIGEDKFNLMESNSTVYKAQRSIFVPDWKTFDKKLQDKNHHKN